MQDLKKEAARAALAFIRKDSVIGLGAGSTIAHLVGCIKENAELSSSIQLVTSSFSTKLLLEKSGFVVKEMGSTAVLDLYFDGCDQFDRHLNALKSGGGIHTREKIGAAMAHSFILIGDESKSVERLDGKYPLVIEVIPDALAFVVSRLTEVFEGAQPVLRMGEKKDGAVITENGNFLIDCRMLPFPEPSRVNEQVGMMPGVLAHSLFFGMADKAIIAGSGGIEVREPE